MKKIKSLFLLTILSLYGHTLQAGELEDALGLVPDLAKGKKIYQLCSACHGEDGRGRDDGSFPVIAGQHRKVVIKQLSDIRARNRENPTMYPFSDAATIGGAQSVADVAGYIQTLKTPSDWGKGPGTDVDEGRKLYAENCSDCHGVKAEGVEEAFYPKLRNQHFNYLVRQLEWMQTELRKNANPVMLKRIQSLKQSDYILIADYISRL